MKHKSPDIFDVNLEDFEQKVIEQSKQVPILVDLWAEWCSPCIFIAPVLYKLIDEFAGKLKLAKVEVDEGDNMKIAGKYGARGFPTVILFQHGKEVARFHSAKPAHFIREFIEEHAELEP